VLKRLDSESVDWIYLDPPFFSNRPSEILQSYDECKIIVIFAAKINYNDIRRI
jgi:16S rRNA G966 N2-methylase RsmD